MRELVNALAEFEGLGIDFISYNEGADTTTPQGSLFGIMASLAEFERSLIAERVKAGMQRAKAQGKHTGRPALLPHPYANRGIAAAAAAAVAAGHREAGGRVGTDGGKC